MKKHTWQVVEDSGGNITLFVFDGVRCVWASNGYETVPEALLGDIERLHRGAKVTDWFTNIDNPQEHYNSLVDFPAGWEIIADQCGIYYDVMNDAGRKCFTGDVQ